MTQNGADSQACPFCSAAPEAPIVKGATRPALGPAALRTQGNNAEQHLDARDGVADVYTASLAALEGRADGTDATLAGSDAGDHKPQEWDVTRSTWKGKLYPDVSKPKEADLNLLWNRMMVSLDAT